MKRSEIAAARVQVALARRRGLEVPDWMDDLARTPMSNADKIAPKAPSDGYIPSTESVMTAYRGGWAPESIPGKNADGEFRRWLARHDIELAASLGWYPLGTHVDDPDVELEFSSSDTEDGLPDWERPVGGNRNDQ